MSSNFLRIKCIWFVPLGVLTLVSGMALGGVNGDTKLDAVFANNGQSNRVCLGHGAGLFTCSDVSSSDTFSSFGVALGATISIPNFDHFLSYLIKHEAEVSLEDQFGKRFFTLEDPVALLNPADKDGEGITDAATHLISYKVKGPEFDKVENVLVENQFGDFVVDLKKPDRLLVPASKSLSGPLPPPDNNTHDVDHFLCYQIEDDDDDNLGILISVVDQFNQPKLFDVKKPRRFCNPVDKNGEGIKNPQTHLMCFSVRRATGEPKHERIDGIFVNDQFGPGRVRTKKERELCVPSTKTLP